MKQSSRNYIWFFGVLGLLATAAVGINAVYNLRQQLTPEQLSQARQLWEKNGPKDYRLEYSKTLDQTETFVVVVRNGETQSVLLRPSDPSQGPGQNLEPRLFPYYGIDALFDDIDTFLKKDAQPGSPRAFNRALFDPADGHLIDYLRSVSATRQRIHIQVKRLDPGKQAE